MNPLDPNSPFNGPLTPSNFRQKNNNNSQNGSGNNPEKFSSTSKTRFVPLILGGLALLILPITIWQVNQQQDVRQQASEEQPIQERAIAQIGEEYITEEDVDLEYTRQQNATAYTTTPSSLKNDILNDLIRKKLIAIEAEERGVSVTEEEIENRLEIHSTLSQDSNINREIASDIALEEKIAALISPSAVVNFAYSNSSEEEVLSLFQTIRENAIEDEDLVTAVENLAAQSDNINLMEEVTITQDNRIFSSGETSEILSLNEDEISDILENNNRFFIVEIISTSEGEYESFSNFMGDKRDEYVEILTN